MGIGSSSLLCPVMESVSARMEWKRKDAKLERIGSARSGRKLQVGIYVSNLIFCQEALKRQKQLVCSSVLKTVFVLRPLYMVK
jgi:hypothetical protein